MVFAELPQALLAVERQGATHIIRHLPTHYQVFRPDQSTTISQPYQKKCWYITSWTPAEIPTDAQPLEEVLP